MFAMQQFSLIIPKLSLAAGSAWNPADKSANATLSGNNTILNSSSGISWAKGTVSYASGKYYFTVTVGATTHQIGAGIGKSSANPSGYFDTNSWGLQVAGVNWFILTNNGATAYDTTLTAAANDIINIAYDASGGKLYLGINGSYRKSDGSSGGDPGAGSNPSLSGLSGTFFPMGIAAGASSNVTINTTPSSPPTGFTVWG